MNRFVPRWLARWLSRRRDAWQERHAPEASAHVPMLDCESVMRQLWDYLDSELTTERMEQIRQHISMCKRCYPQYEFERSFVAALAARRRDHPDPDGLRANLLQALQARGLSAS